MGRLTPAQMPVDKRELMQSMAWSIYSGAVGTILSAAELPDTAALKELAANSLVAAKVFQDMVTDDQETFYAPYL